MRRLGYKTSGVIILVILLSLSQLYAEKATKRIVKSFNINNNTKIDISNKHGNVVIQQWDKNILDLKVTVEAEGKNEAKTQQILDAIEIDIADRISSGNLAIYTEIDDINGKASFSVDYEISMPNANPLQLTSSFGNVYMGSYRGDLNLEVKYGQLMAEDLDNASIRVDFSASRCEIETLQHGKLDLRYSKMSIEDVGDVDISSQFSELEIENAGDLQVEGRYGSLEIDNLRSLRGDIKFGGLDIKWLEESLMLDTRHGDGINLERVSSNFKQIEIDGQFCSVNIKIEKGASARLQFELQFGNLKAHGDGINFNKVVKDHNTSEYEGYLVSANATSSIKVHTKYGNIGLEVD